jgi:hypothetical protein
VIRGGGGGPFQTFLHGGLNGREEDGVGWAPGSRVAFVAEGDVTGWITGIAEASIDGIAGEAINGGWTRSAMESASPRSSHSESELNSGVQNLPIRRA